MIWETKKVLVTVKAYPELSRKHGAIVCMAGITEDYDWIRLYPIPFESFRGKKSIPKYSWISVQCRKSKGEKLSRKESYRIRPETIKIIDNTLVKQPIDWKSRNKLIFKMLDKSIEELKDKYRQDRTSLGVIKPKKIRSFYVTDKLEKYEQDASEFQMTLDGEARSLLEKIPHIFRYDFDCNDSRCKGHQITCEDWELFESFRSWRDRYDVHCELWNKLRYKYFEWMVNKRDLYFYMGTHSLYPVWLIIGIYYPPKSST